MLRFRPLFTLNVSHSFYDGECRDFRFLLPADSCERLRGARLVARELEGKLHVLYEADGTGAPRVRRAGTTLRIGLQLSNAYFGNFTQVPSGFPRRRLYYTNAADPDRLASQGTVALVGEVFTHDLTETARPATVTLRGAGGEVVHTETITADDALTSVTFDLRGRPGGRLSLEEVFPAATRTAGYYLDAELHAGECAGIVEVAIDDLYDSPPALEVSFDAKQEELRYYLVVRNYTGTELGHLTVSDAGFRDEGRSEIRFDKVAAASRSAAETAMASLLAGSGETVVLFRSRTPLPRRDRGRRRIQLSKNGDVLIANLPQPGPDRAKADMVIHLSKP